MSSAVRKLAVELGARSYPIRIGAGLLSDPTNWRDTLSGKQVLVVSDEHVAPLYLDRVVTGLHDAALSTLILPAGEAHKTLDSTTRIFAALAELNASRDATIIALGGGVIGDLAGFAAACWMRGIAFVQMPTTLLAMVDSSVGGKTGVDLPQGKNLVGAFHQPRAVIADTDTLSSLPDRELRAGFAEVIKYGALGDAQFFAWLETHADALLARDPHALADCIAHCCAQKAGIVARDETERGERALLNFGHSFGHALETVCGYGSLLHGEAVAIGMCRAARLSARLGMAADADSQRLRDLLTRFGLPTAIPAGTDADALLAAMRLDKKNASGRLRLILWRGVGRAEIAEGVDEGTIRELLRESG
ncbi:MAG: 3-dehydroquinate synthase [Xanthomonadales bacterium PRO7]|nr:3-dehydroquinate synthase [Xanthomonadales bacterium PRO7]